MSETVTIAANAVTAKLHEPSRELKLEVQAMLSYLVDGAEHSDAFKMGNWDGRSSFLDFRQGTFPAGFTTWLAAKLRLAGHKVNIVRKPLPEPLGPANPKVDDFGEDPRYDYQDQVVDKLLKHGQIIAQVATGGGKSRIAKKAFARIKRPTLFLTTRGILMYQMRDAFVRDLGIHPSVLGDGQFGHTVVGEDGIERQAVKKMCVGMVQTLVERLEEKTVPIEVERAASALATKELKAEQQLRAALKAKKIPILEIDRQVKALEARQEAARPSLADLRADAAVKVDAHNRRRAQTIKLLGMFELVVLEEAHEASGNSYFEILRYCTNAHYRLALTATPFMKENQESNMRLMACSGPIAIKVTEKMLIDRGILARPYFTFMQLREKPVKLYRHTSWQSAYRIGIVENDYRNALIVRRCSLMARLGLTSMVLIQQTKHGDVLQGMLAAAGLRVEFIRGEDDQVGRKAALARLERGDIDVLVGTTILDVGVDVPAVGHVCLAGGGKAEVALRQRIGRGLRAKNGSANVCFVTDFADTFNTFLATHAAQRLAIIEGTEGFAEQVFKDGADAPFAALGFVRKAA